MKELYCLKLKELDLKKKEKWTAQVVAVQVVICREEACKERNGTMEDSKHLSEIKTNCSHFNLHSLIPYIHRSFPSPAELI